MLLSNSCYSYQHHVAVATDRYIATSDYGQQNRAVATLAAICIEY